MKVRWRRVFRSLVAITLLCFMVVGAVQCSNQEGSSYTYEITYSNGDTEIVTVSRKLMRGRNNQDCLFRVNSGMEAFRCEVRNYRLVKEGPH